MDLQALVDGINQREERARADDETALTLGSWIDLLGQLPPDDLVVGVGGPASYRGYYSDLAFSPEPDLRLRADTLLAVARECMGQVFTGYKGGDFPMHARSPVWLSGYGEASGWRMVGLRLIADGVWAVAVRREDEYHPSVTGPYVEVGW